MASISQAMNTLQSSREEIPILDVEHQETGLLSERQSRSNEVRVVQSESLESGKYDKVA